MCSNWDIMAPSLSLSSLFLCLSRIAEITQGKDTGLWLMTRRIGQGMLLSVEKLFWHCFWHYWRIEYALFMGYPDHKSHKGSCSRNYSCEKLALLSIYWSGLQFSGHGCHRQGLKCHKYFWGRKTKTMNFERWIIVGVKWQTGVFIRNIRDFKTVFPKNLLQSGCKVGRTVRVCQNCFVSRLCVN